MVTATVTQSKNPVCNGESTGSLTLAASGGSGSSFQFSVKRERKERIIKEERKEEEKNTNRIKERKE